MAIVVDPANNTEFVGRTPTYLGNPNYIVVTRAELPAYQALVAAGVPRKYWKAGVAGPVEMDTVEKAQVDAAFFAARKQQALLATAAEVQTKHEEQGFEYPPASGNFFALDLHTRTLLLGLLAGRDFLVYPVTFGTKDHGGQVALATADEVVQFYAAAMAAVKAREDAGTTKKAAIRAALTPAELDTVLGLRSGGRTR